MKPQHNGSTNSHMVNVDQHPTQHQQHHHQNQRFQRWRKFISGIVPTSLIINPYGNGYYRWLVVISAATAYCVITLIMRAVFADLQRKYQVSWYFLDYISDIVYYVDMIIWFRTGYLEQGQLVTNARKLARRYIQTSGFKLDLMSILPCDIVYLITGLSHRWVPASRLNRLLKFHRLREFIDRTETRTNFPNAIRITHLIFYIFIIMHWMACLYFAISLHVGPGTDEWVFPNTSVYPYDSVGFQYVYSLYWSTLTLTTIGEIHHPTKDVEYMFVIISFLLGVLIFASIVGSISTMIGNLNIARTEFQGRVDAIKRYMEFRKVERHIQKRVFQWFEYLWMNRQSMDEEVILAVLPEKLKAEILMNVHLDTLRRVRIFRNCEPGLLQALVLKLKLQVFSPGDYVCRKGDVGREMYIVKRGCLSVVSDGEDQVFASLTEGSVFGEISILDIPGNKTGRRRTANVRSEGYSDLFCLSKQDLWQTINEYPDARKKLVERGKQLLREQKLLDEDIVREAEEKAAEEEAARKDRDRAVAANLKDMPGEVVKMIRELGQLQTSLYRTVVDLSERKIISCDQETIVANFLLGSAHNLTSVNTDSFTSVTSNESLSTAGAAAKPVIESRKSSAPTCEFKKKLDNPITSLARDETVEKISKISVPVIVEPRSREQNNRDCQGSRAGLPGNEPRPTPAPIGQTSPIVLDEDDEVL